MKDPSKYKVGRRNFTKIFAAGTIGASLPFSGSAKPYERILGSNDIIGIGIIGMGSISHNHLDRLKKVEDKAKVVAVCDIYQPRLEWGKSATGATAYHDYNDLLADENVDAVIICTPDHWHAPMAIDAMRAGKDVDVEKPMCMTVEEAKKMVEVAEETGQILAIDSEHTAHGIWQPAKKTVEAGILGKLLWSQTSRSRNTGDEPPWNYDIDPNASPKNLDWDRFLGPAPKVPFNKERFFRWRRYWDYSGGIVTDLYVHHITPLLKVIGPEFPIQVTAMGGNFQYPQDVLEVPDTFVTTFKFPGNHSMMVGGSLANSVELPILIRGHEANIHFYGPDHRRPSYLVIKPEEPFMDKVKEKIRKSDLEGDWHNKSSFRIESPPSEPFTDNFLRCMRTREKPVLDGRLGYMAQVAVSLAVRSYRENKIMGFDPVREVVKSTN